MRQTVTISQHWLDSEQGRRYAQCWHPASAGSPADGIPILLLHDSLGCIALWRDFPALLASQTGRPVIAYDRLGFGQSDARHDRLAMDFIAQEAEVSFPLLKAHFGFARCIIMGHSVGGGMAVHCAASHPASCLALITESAQVCVEDKTRAGIAQARGEFRTEAGLQRLVRYHGAKARWVVDAWTETWLDPGFADWSLAPVLSRVHCPTLAIHGAEDEYGSNLHPEGIASMVKADAELLIMPGVRHVPHREQDRSVALAIASFIQRHC